MALRKKSLFLYGFEVTSLNRSLDFRAVSLETPRQATLRLGFYSLGTLMTEIKRAMEAVDSEREYTVTADRTFNDGTENRVTIETDGVFLELLFLTGPRAESTCAPLIGFPYLDQTGATTYTGTATAGIALIPEREGYSYLSPPMMKKLQGAVNVTASGDQEAIIWGVTGFWEVEFKFEPVQKVLDEWAPLMTWIIKKRLVEFTPHITEPDEVLEGVIEKTEADGKGLAYTLKEMLPEFPFFHTTGKMTFRERRQNVSLI